MADRRYALLGHSHAAGSGSVVWGAITGTLSAQTDLQSALDGKQPIDADLTAIAALAGTSGFLKKTAADTWALDTNSYALSSHNHAGVYEPADATILKDADIGVTVAAFSHTHSYLPLTGGTLSGKLTTVATALGGAGLNLPHGTAPSAPTDGDVWTTTAGMYVRVNGSTVGPLGTGGGGTLDGLSDVVITAAATGDYLRYNGTNWVDNAGVPAADVQSGNLGSGVLEYATASSTASAFKVAFLNTTGATSGNFGTLFESGASVFTYNPSTDVLSVPTVYATTGVEVGNASDTTITRAAAGVINVEGKGVFQQNGSYTSAQVYYATTAATGGNSGDIWFQYTA